MTIENNLTILGLIISIGIVPFIIWVYNRFAKKIILTGFTASQNTINQNCCINEMHLYNTKNKKIVIQKIKLVLIDSKNKYFIEMPFDKNFIELPEDTNKSIKINPVSFFYINKDNIKIDYLLLQKRDFYFILKCADGKTYNIFLNNKISNFIKRANYIRKKRNTINIKSAVLNFEGIIHSPDFHTGISYKDNQGNKKVGFIGEHIILDGVPIVLQNKDIPIINLLFNNLSLQGCTDISARSIQTIINGYEMLGDKDYYKRDRDKIYNIKLEDTLGFEIKN